MAIRVPLATLAERDRLPEGYLEATPGKPAHSPRRCRSSAGGTVTLEPRHQASHRSPIMYVSQENPAQTHARLRRVIAEAELRVYDEPYVFEEVSVERFPAHHIGDALAFVRDEDVWSALVPRRQGEQQAAEAFSLFSFHFPPNLDNSGFVGWLASHLKASVGTGVFVVCGQNSARGGIFDYWGAPLSVADEVLNEVHRLREKQGEA